MQSHPYVNYKLNSFQIKILTSLIQTREFDTKIDIEKLTFKNNHVNTRNKKLWWYASLLNLKTCNKTKQYVICAWIDKEKSGTE